MTYGPIIILEGPDGGGKSTLAKTLVENGWRYEHCGPPEELAATYWTHRVEQAREGPVVFDRLHLGSYVYGKAFRGVDDMSPFERYKFDGLLESYHTLVVYVDPGRDVCDANLERGPDNDDAAIYEDASKRELVRKLYYELLYGIDSSLMMLDVAEYDYICDDAADLIAVGELMKEAVKQPLIPFPVPVIGNRRNPKAIYCVDQLGDEALRYLGTALQQTQPLSDYAIMQASYVSALKHPAAVVGKGFVALGNKAANRLMSEDIPFTVAPDPTEVMRHEFKAGLINLPKALA